MFTGLVRGMGRVTAAAPFGQGRRISVDVASLGAPPAVGASIAVSGVCLTVTSVQGSVAAFDAVRETVERSTLGSLPVGAAVNLEPALRAGDPLDGHFVLGHVDAVASLQAIQERPESRVLRFSLPAAVRAFVAGKGSIAVDGISLTVVEATSECFTVSIIPHTYGMTTLGRAAVGDRVNLEADVLARYAVRAQDAAPALSEAFLRDHGFA